MYYTSGKTIDNEAKFHNYELEVLAIIKALQRFRIYLIGILFKIVTDCQAFAQTMKKTDVCMRIARWTLFLQDFHYYNTVVEHRPGKNVDVFSRNALPTAMLITKCQEGIIARLQRNRTEDEELSDI